MQRSSLFLLMVGATLSGSPAPRSTTTPRPRAPSDTILPGSRALDPTRIHPYSLDRELTLTRGDSSRPFGRQAERLSTTTLQGRPALLHVLTFDTPSALTVDSTWVDPSSLAPIRMLSANRSRTSIVEFEPGKVRTTTIPTGGVAAVAEHRVAAPSFEWNMLPIALAALPLRAGYEATLAVFSERAGRVVWYGIEVTGEALPRKSGYQSPMWRVVATPDSGGPSAQWWVSQRHGFVDQALISEPGISIRYSRSGL